MKRRIRTASVVATALLVGLSVAAAGCGKYSFNNLKAMKSFKDANDHYKAQQWDAAVQNYEAAVASNPDLVEAYFFLGNSYDNLYKPSRAGEAENDAYMQKAIANYRIAAERETNPQMKKLALEYLVAAYGAEKLNDPSQAEPIVQQMIQMDPNDTNAYFQLSKIYEDAGRYEEAEAALLKAKDAKPNDPGVYTAISGYYNRQGDFAKTMEALHQAADLEPNNPEGYQRVSVFYWEKAFRDHRLAKEEKVQYIEKGIAAADKAISLNPNYAEALTYKNILLRMAANETTDMAKRNQLIKEADELRNKAMELNKKKPAGAQ
jgi:tetratricopeptide (TPR) repeat protein